FFSSRRRHTRCLSDWSSDVCSSDLMVDMARRIMHFYAHESCGWCIPCREGTSWLKKMLERFHAGLGRPEDIDLIGELSKNMLGRSEERRVGKECRARGGGGE